MRFRNNDQKNRAISILLAMVDLERLWTRSGPTARIDLAGDVSADRDAVFGAAISLYDGNPISSVPVSHDLEVAAAFAALAELLVTKSPLQIDTWIKKYRTPKSQNPQLTALCEARPEEWAQIVIKALDAADNASEAARKLNVSERTMRRWLHHEAIARLAPRWVPKTVSQ